jgi:hypothetical protein
MFSYGKTYVTIMGGSQSQQTVTCGIDTIEEDGQCVSSKTCPPSVSAVSGWHTNGKSIGVVPNVTTMNQCVDYGMRNNLPAVGWRNASHPTKRYVNTCWTHNEGFDHAKADAFIKKNGTPTDTVHTTFVFKKC